MARKRQPVRPIPAQSQGDRQRNEALQGAAPIADRSAPQVAGPPTATPPPAAGSRPSLPAGGGPLGNVFRPTERPGEAPTAGNVGGQPDIIPEDPDELLKLMYQLYPRSSLLRLMSRGGP